jgi:hypothetical protein
MPAPRVSKSYLRHCTGIALAILLTAGIAWLIVRVSENLLMRLIG